MSTSMFLLYGCARALCFSQVHILMFAFISITSFRGILKHPFRFFSFSYFLYLWFTAYSRTLAFTILMGGRVFCLFFDLEYVENLFWSRLSIESAFY